jgi:hypothetical protein
VAVEGIRVDAFFRDRGLVVQLDGCRDETV